MAYPIYTTILALATAGVPVAISILIARKETQGFPGESRRILRVSLLLLAVFGLLLTLLVMASAKFLALHVLQDGRAYYAIVAVAPAIFLAGLMSVFRGYFQGQQTMLPTAVQVVEQIFVTPYYSWLSAVSKRLGICCGRGHLRRGCGRFGRIAGLL